MRVCYAGGRCIIIINSKIPVRILVVIAALASCPELCTQWVDWGCVHSGWIGGVYTVGGLGVCTIANKFVWISID